MRLVPRSFYKRDTVDIARNLLGKVLVRRINDKIVSGIIIETEAYRYKDDPASHAFGGRTERNTAMFGEVGRAYVYFIYGMHYCINAVARSDESEAGAVLIRSLFPKEGLDFMMKQRQTKIVSNLTNGPAKLTQALHITGEQYGEDLTKISNLYVIDDKKTKTYDIEERSRIGIKKATDKLWNFRVSREMVL
jgi:DNA-3-methyladenine glycosylase